MISEWSCKTKDWANGVTIQLPKPKYFAEFFWIYIVFFTDHSLRSNSDRLWSIDTKQPRIIFISPPSFTLLSHFSLIQADGRDMQTGRLKRRIIASMVAVAAMLFHLRVRSQRAVKSVVVRSGRDGSKRHNQMVSVWIVKRSQPHERARLLVSLHSWWAQKKVKWKLGWKKQREMQSRWKQDLMMAHKSPGRVVTYGATNRLKLSLSQGQHLRSRELWWQSALCPKMFASCFTWETRDREWQRHRSEFKLRVCS